MAVAASHGDSRLYDAVADAARKAQTPELKYLYLYALPAFRDPALVERALEGALSPQLRSQDGPIYLGRFFANGAARDRAWKFLADHWTELKPKITIAQGDMALVSSLGRFCRASARDDIQQFFSSHPLPSATRTLQQTMERITDCITLSDRQTKVVSDWLEEAR